MANFVLFILVLAILSQFFVSCLEPYLFISNLQNKTVLLYHAANITFVVHHIGNVNIVATRIGDSNEPFYQDYGKRIDGMEMCVIRLHNVTDANDNCFHIVVTSGHTAREDKRLVCLTVKGWYSFAAATLCTSVCCKESTLPSIIS